MMKLTVLYVGSSLLAPLRRAERDINRDYGIDLELRTYNFGAPFTEDEWLHIENDLLESEIVFRVG